MLELHHIERSHVLHDRRPVRCFQQIIGEHAMHMVDMACATRKNENNSARKASLKHWATLTRLNDEWIGLLCYGCDPQSEFRKLASQLVHLYTEALGDYMIDHHTEIEKVQKLCKLSGAFYGELSPHERHRQTTTQQWNQYTNSLINMMNVENQTTDTFHYTAGMCIRAGRYLGLWLDSSLAS